jgi:hypothetical protein
MYSIWTRHVKPEDKEQFEKSLRHNRWVLECLTGVLNQLEDETASVELNPKVYDTTPNWAYKQADLNGYRRCLKQIKRLINLDHKEE